MRYDRPQPARKYQMTMRSRDRKHINDGFEPTLYVFGWRVQCLTNMACTAADYADVMERAEKIDEASADIERLYKQCIGLCEIWPHREAEFVAQAYAQLVEQIHIILTTHDEAMAPAEDEDGMY